MRRKLTLKVGRALGDGRRVVGVDGGASYLLAVLLGLGLGLGLGLRLGLGLGLGLRLELGSGFICSR